MGEVSQTTVDDILNCKKIGGRIIAIGTTTLRILETAFLRNNKMECFSGYTDIFIKPGFKIKTTDILLTNFHSPMSSLFILTHALCGKENIKTIYNHAINNKYRFFSYGDCCLLRNINETF